jgi:tight adherence protein C
VAIASSALLFAGILFLLLGVGMLVSERPSRLRLGRLGAGTASETEVGIFPKEQSLLVRLLAPFAGLGREAERGRAGRKLRTRLVHAGYRSPGASVVFRGSRVILVVGLPLVFYLTPLRLIVRESLVLVTIVSLAGFAYVLPSYLLDWRIKRRSREVERHLPDALDLLAVCVEAGLGLIQALARVGQEIRRISPVLAGELGLVNLATRAGRSNAEALRELAQRTNVREVSVLVTMLTQTERFGTSLADALRTHSDAMRTRRMQLAEERAAKASLRMLFPTAIILLALLVLIVGLASVQASKILNGP